MLDQHKCVMSIPPPASWAGLASQAHTGQLRVRPQVRPSGRYRRSGTVVPGPIALLHRLGPYVFPLDACVGKGPATPTVCSSMEQTATPSLAIPDQVLRCVVS